MRSSSEIKMVLRGRPPQKWTQSKKLSWPINGDDPKLKMTSKWRGPQKWRWHQTERWPKQWWVPKKRGVKHVVSHLYFISFIMTKNTFNLSTVYISLFSLFCRKKCLCSFFRCHFCSLLVILLLSTYSHVWIVCVSLNVPFLLTGSHNEDKDI